MAVNHALTPGCALRFGWFTAIKPCYNVITNTYFPPSVQIAGPGDMSHNTLPQAIQGNLGIHEYMYNS